MKTLFDLTREIAEAEGIASPKPPIYDVVFNIYKELGGAKDSFNCTYDILQAMLDEGLVSGGGGITPSGSLEILENGVFNVYNYASASVNVPQGVFPSGNLTITQNGNYEVAGYESASVSVSGGGGSVFDDLANAGYSAQDIAAVESMTEDHINLTETSYVDTSEVVYFTNRFKNSNLVYAPKLNTSNGTSFYSMFWNCKYLQFVPYLDTSRGTNFENMFRECRNLESVPNLDTSTGYNVLRMFYGCSKLEAIPDLDLSGVVAGTTMEGVFGDCSALVSIGKLNLSSAEGSRIGGSGTGRPFYNCISLENVGGFTGLKISIDLQDCSKLTRQAVINILTEAADLTGQTGATLTLHANVKARLTQEDYDLAASKNWTIA